MQIISQTTLRTPWVPALSVTRERMESWLRSALKYFSHFLVKYFQSTCLPGLICAKSVEDGELIPRLVHSHWSMSVETVLSLVGVCWSQQKTRNALISSQSPSLGFWWIELCLYIFKLFSDSRSCFPSIYGVNGCTSITTADGQKEACFCNTELLVESKYWADCSSRGQGFKCCWHPYSHWSRSIKTVLWLVGSWWCWRQLSYAIMTQQKATNALPKQHLNLGPTSSALVWAQSGLFILLLGVMELRLTTAPLRWVLSSLLS